MALKPGSGKLGLSQAQESDTHTCTPHTLKTVHLKYPKIYLDSPLVHKKVYTLDSGT